MPIPSPPPAVADFLRRLDTAALQRGGMPTRVLVVVNATDAVGSGVVRFRAAFPVRAAVGAQPVTVRDERGAVVPSRLAESTIEACADLPVERALWTLTLEFVVSDVPPGGWRGYASVFADFPESRSGDAAFWREQNTLDLPVWETDCHAGDFPVIGTFPLGGTF